MRYNTSVPNEPNTHDDFKPTNKLESFDLSLKALLNSQSSAFPQFWHPISDHTSTNLHPIRKCKSLSLSPNGVPELPQCGFSSLAVRVLKLYHLSLTTKWPGGALNLDGATISGVKAKGLIEGLMFALRKGVSKIMVEGDSKLVIQAMQGVCSVSWNLEHTIEDIKWMVTKFSIIS
ncbi:hypothetical protein DVH24_000086 [Malus domestica]|uniref:RNase H type-1 domain-containing protein n=1 Tax=Malus domestica TaxID=3750 RepID=A0A498J1Q1_MALDO|nr:hypothetical protein DVH24_000086 [Malus domestica]